MEQFSDAVERVLLLAKEPSSEDKLKLYGLFKQATVGDINIECPSIFNMAGRAKWYAWNEQKGKPEVQAKMDYVAVVDRLIQETGL
jgi:diazepam-binding inhibitor (GABA receptor modulating acyl-CoA-binding protein)